MELSIRPGHDAASTHVGFIRDCPDCARWALVSAEKDGWSALRIHVFLRDRGCVMAERRVMEELVVYNDCRGPFGQSIESDALHLMEWDHVKEEVALGVRAPNDEAHGVTACPWHHRLSRKHRTDSAAAREKIRAYLTSLYPVVWAGILR